MLFSSVPELQQVRLLRLQLTYARETLEACPNCQKHLNTMLPLLGNRMHLATETEMFSMRDLMDLHEGKLIPLLERSVETLSNQITQHCEICKATGLVCQICQKPQLIYPFQVATVVPCRACGTHFHRDCFTGEANCPLCNQNVK